MQNKMGNVSKRAVAAEMFSPFRAVLFEGKGVGIEGHNGLVLFEEDQAIFKRKKGLIIFRGKGLKIEEISLGEAFVSGSIESVTFAVKQGEVNV